MTNRITIGQGSFQRAALVGEVQLSERDLLAYVTYSDDPAFDDDGSEGLWAQVLDTVPVTACTEDDLYDLVQLERSTRELIGVQLRDAHLEAA